MEMKRDNKYQRFGVNITTETRTIEGWEIKEE